MKDPGFSLQISSHLVLDVLTSTRIDIWPGSPSKQLFHSEALPVSPIKRRVRQIVGGPIALTRNVPEAYLNVHAVAKVKDKVVERSKKIF
jgi:hypothetical protein